MPLRCHTYAMLNIWSYRMYHLFRLFALNLLQTPIAISIAYYMAELCFGEPLGTLHGVTAYSNLDDSFFSGEKHFLWGIYTGYKYQCVEFARRYLLCTSGCQFDQCFRAAEIFHMKDLTNVETGAVFPLVQCKNGDSKHKPQPGNILVYPHDQELMPVGHVAIVAEVGDDWVGIAEQNQDSFSWQGASYGRRIPLRCDPTTGAWTMEETDPELLQPDGWLFAPDAPRREDVHAPLTPLDAFVPKHDPCSFMRRRVVQLSPEEQEARKGWCYPHIPPAETPAEQLICDYLAQNKPGYLANMKSVVYPSESSGVGCIGTLNATFRTIAHGLQLIFLHNAMAGELKGMSLYDWASERYGVPRDLVSLIEDEVRPSTVHNCCVMTMTLGFIDGRPQAVDCNLDALLGVYEAAVLQGRVANANGHDEGWTPSINSDVKRFVDKVLTATNKAEVLYFIDLGTSEALGNVFVNEDDRQAYDLYRLNALIVLDFVTKAKADAGRVVQLNDIVVTESGHVVLKACGSAVRMVHKMCTWAQLFRICAVNDGLRCIVHDAQRAGMVTFYPPLYTHVTASPNFLCDMHAAYASRDESKFSEGQIELKENLPEINQGALTMFSDSRISPDEQSLAPTKYKVQVVAVGGYYSTGHFLESRSEQDYPEWRPACYRFIMHKREFTRPEVPDC